MDPLFDWLLRVALALLFGAAALHKARDRAAFTETLAAYEILPRAVCGFAVHALIALEAALALLVILPATKGPAGIGIAALLVVYSVAMGTNLARGRRDIDCGCLGPGHRQPLSAWLLVRNAVLIAAAGLVVIPAGDRALGAIDAVSFAGGLLVLALVAGAFDQLVAQAERVRALRSLA